jgi:hypothetical protein
LKGSSMRSWHYERESIVVKNVVEMANLSKLSSFYNNLKEFHLAFNLKKNSYSSY